MTIPPFTHNTVGYAHLLASTYLQTTISLNYQRYATLPPQFQPLHSEFMRSANAMIQSCYTPKEEPSVDNWLETRWGRTSRSAHNQGMIVMTKTGHTKDPDQKAHEA